MFDDALKPDDDADVFDAPVAASRSMKRRSHPATATGLHAKIYVADAGWKSRIWVGSANATHAAFNRNVEFLAELEGPEEPMRHRGFAW